MTTVTPDRSFAADAELRRLNRATVQQYMEDIAGERRLTRHRLFAEDGSAGLWTTETGEPIVISGMEKLKEHAVWSLRCLPDWVWYNVEIFETQDPNRFWVECDGEGKIIFPGYRVGHYQNHFMHYFRLQDGRIKENREFMNPVMQMRALGIEVPKIKREGIPAD
jgi:phenazine biosynthesis protein